MPIAEKMLKMVEGSSLRRKMFEEGAKLKAQYGAEKVYDFSLGNPDVPPPQEFKKVLRALVEDDRLSHGYRDEGLFGTGLDFYEEAVHRELHEELLIDADLTTRVVALKDAVIVFEGSAKEIDRAKFKEIYGEEVQVVRAASL